MSVLLVCFLQVRYICSADGCQLTEYDGHHVQDSDVLVLKRIQQTIRAVDQRSGVERYNHAQSLLFLKIRSFLKKSVKPYMGLK